MAKNLQITESYSTEIQFLRGISSIIQDATPVVPPVPIDTANLLIKTGTDNIIGTQAFDFTYGLFPAISAYIADMTDVFTLFKIDEFTTSETLTYNTAIGFKFSKTPYLTTIDTDLLYAKLNGGNTFNGTQVFNGDIIQNGAAYETHAEKLYSKQDLIIVRECAISGLATGDIAGYIAKNPKGDGFDIVLGVDNNGIVKVGKDGTVLQSLATRDDNIVNGNGVVYDSARKTFADAGYKWALKNGDIAQNFASNTFIENGTSLVNKYLGLHAKADDSDLLDGHNYDWFAQRNGELTQNFNAKILTITDYLQSSTFISGITGTGFKYGLDAECDNLKIREGFTCNTFINNKINISNGDMIVSDSATISRFSGTTAIYFDEPHPFKAGQRLRCQQLSSDKTSLNVYYYNVQSIGKSGVEYWINGVISGTATPKEGDLLVRWNGGLLYLNSSDAVNGAYLDVVKEGLTKTRVGNLIGINSPKFGQLVGDGIYANSGYFENVKVSGEIEVTGNSNIYTKTETGTNIATAKSEAINTASADATIKVSALQNSLGSLAYDSLVETAKLGTTVIVGGLIKTSLLDVNYIKTNILTANNIAALNLEVGNQISMGPNATIDWSKVTGTEGIATTTDVNYKTTHIDGTSITTGKIIGDRLQVGAWNINADSLYSGGIFLSGIPGIEINATNKRVMIHKDGGNFVNTFYDNADYWGIKGNKSGATVFQLGSTNKISSWNFDNTTLYTGTKKTTGFTSAVNDMSIGSGNILANKFKIEDGVMSCVDGIFSGNITGSTITGSTLRTAASGKRVEIVKETNSIKAYTIDNNLMFDLDDDGGTSSLGKNSASLSLHREAGSLSAVNRQSADGSFIKGEGIKFAAPESGLNTHAASALFMETYLNYPYWGGYYHLNEIIAAGLFIEAKNTSTGNTAVKMPAIITDGEIGGRTLYKEMILNYTNTDLFYDTIEYAYINIAVPSHLKSCNWNFVITATGAGYSRVNLPTNCEVGTQYVFMSARNSTQSIRIYTSNSILIQWGTTLETYINLDRAKYLTFIMTSNGWIAYN